MLVLSAGSNGSWLPVLSALRACARLSKPVRRVQCLAALAKWLQGGDRSTTAPERRSVVDPGMAGRLPLRILIADDNPVNQKVGRSMLNRMGYAPDLADHGGAVLDLLKTRVYDLILLDVQMPVLDGYEVCRHIRQSAGEGVKPVLIALTGNAMVGDREKCLAAGMDDYLSKPVRIEALAGLLEKWGSQRNLAR